VQETAEEDDNGVEAFLSPIASKICVLQRRWQT